jgi:hypothetical protein
MGTTRVTAATGGLRSILCRRFRLEAEGRESVAVSPIELHDAEGHARAQLASEELARAETGTSGDAAQPDRT